MGVLLFLLVPAVVVAIGWGVMVLRHRRPQGMNHSIEAFRREMQVLSPDHESRRRYR